MSQTKAQLISDLVQALAFTATASAPTNGMFLSATNELAISTNSSTRLTVDSSGNVGIGTTSPAHAVHIAGTTTPELIVEDTTNNVKAVVGADNSVGRIGTDTNHGLTLRTNDTERMRIDTSGRLLVGTSSQSNSALLTVEGNTGNNSGAGELTLQRGEAATSITANESIGHIYFQDNSNKKFAEIACFADAAAGSNDYPGRILFSTTADGASSPTERMRIDSSGNVGIGTTSPGFKLEVNSGSSDSVALFKSSDATARIILRDNGSTSGGYVGVATEDMFFHTNGSERMRIDSSGRVLVGTTSALDATAGSITSNNSSSGGRLALGGNPSSAGATVGEIFGWWNANKVAGLVVASGADTTNKDDGELLFYTSASGPSVQERMRIDRNGNVGIGNSSPSYPLDVKQTSAGTVAALTGSTDGGRSLKFTSADNGIFLGAQWTRDVASSGGIHAWAVDGSEKARIDSSGRLLLGTTTEGYNDYADNLTIADSGHCGITIRTGTTHDGSIYFSDATSGGGEYDGYIYYTQNGRALIFGTAQSERMRIDSSGRLLIGVSSSRTVGGISCPLHVEGTGATSSSITLVRNTNGATHPPYLFFGKTRSGSTGGTTIVQNGDLLGYLGWQGADGNDLDGTAAAIQASVDGTPGSNDMPGRLEFATTRDGNNSPSKTMVINRNGELRLGYGNSDPVSTDHVHSFGDPSLDTVTTNVARLVMQEKSGNWISFKDGGGVHYGTISRNPPGVTYGSNSDYRLKENVENFTNGITLVKQLRPVTFNWNELSGFDTTLTQRGFLAHEVQDVEPNAVVGDKDEMDRYGDCYDAEGRKTQVNVFEHQAKEGETWTFQSEDMRHQQLDPAKLVPLLTAALQEAITKIETLETKVAALEAE